MALRRRALTLAGPFDESLSRPRRRGGMGAARTARAAGRSATSRAPGSITGARRPTARLRRLASAAYAPGSRGAAFRRPARQPRRRWARELRTLAGCVWHILTPALPQRFRARPRIRGGPRRHRRRWRAGDAPPSRRWLRLPVGHAPARCGGSARRRERLVDRPRVRAGRVRDAAAVAPAPGGARRGRAGACSRSRSSARMCRTCSPRPAPSSCRSRHEVRFESTTPVRARQVREPRSAAASAPRPTALTGCWSIDDDVALPRGFLDAFVFLAERFDLAMAQPAHRWRSHAAWNVTRRRPFSLVRETSFVEIGPVSRAARADVRDAAAVPAAAVRMGAGRALVGARARPRLAPGRDRRDPDSARPASGSPAPMTRPTRSTRVGSSSPTVRTRPAAQANRTLVDPPQFWSMKVAIVAEYYPRVGRPDARDLGPPPGTSGPRRGRGRAGDRAAPAAAAAGGAARTLRAGVGARRALERHPRRASRSRRPPRSTGSRSSYLRYLSPPRGRSYASWGAWAAPPLGRALAGLRVDVPASTSSTPTTPVPAGDAVAAPLRTSRSSSRSTAATCSGPTRTRRP